MTEGSKTITEQTFDALDEVIASAVQSVETQQLTAVDHRPCDPADPFDLADLKLAKLEGYALGKGDEALLDLVDELREVMR